MATPELPPNGQDPVRVAVVFGLFPSDPTFYTIVERAPDVGGNPGTPVIIAWLAPGQRYFVDQLQATASFLHYRFSHGGFGFQFGTPTAYFRARPVQWSGELPPIPREPLLDLDLALDDSDGSVDIVVNGGRQVRSIKWASSTIGYPAEGTGTAVDTDSEGDVTISDAFFLIAGETGYVRVTFYDQASAGGNILGTLRASVARGTGAGGAIPTVIEGEIIYDGVGNATLPLSFNDPANRLMSVEAQTKSGLAAWSGWSTITAPYAITVVLDEKHDSHIQYRFTHGNGVANLGSFTAADIETAPGYSFSRTGVATYVDQNGIIQTAASGELRNSHYIGGVRHILTEGASRNECLRSEEMDSAPWVIRGTAVVAANDAIAPDGTLTADKFTGIGTAGNDFFQNISTKFSADARVEPSFWIKRVSTSGTLDIRNPASADGRWLLDLSLLSDGWERIDRTHSALTINAEFIATTPGSAGFHILAGAGGPLSFHVWGFQEEELIFPTSYIATAGSAVTRNADSLSVDHLPVPQESTWYVKGVELGTASIFDARVIGVGSSTASADPRLKLSTISGNKYSFLHDNGIAPKQSDHTVAVALNDTVELRGLLNSDGSVQLGQSLNVAAEVVAAASTASSLVSPWAGQTLWLNGVGGVAGLDGYFAFESIRIAATPIRSMADMRAAGTTIEAKVLTFDADDIASATFQLNIEHDTGDVTIDLNGDDDAKAYRIAIDATAYQSEATTRAATPVRVGRVQQALSLATGIAEGASRFVTIFAYNDTAGTTGESELYSALVTRHIDTREEVGSPDLMVLNSDFEHPTNGAFWCDTVAAFGGTVSINTASPLSGLKDLKIVSDTGATDGEVYAAIQPDGFVTSNTANRRWIPVEEGDNFLVTATLKAQTGHPIEVIAKEVNALKADVSIKVIASISGTSSLAIREAYTVPAGVAYVVFGLRVTTDSSGPRDFFADGFGIRRWFSESSGIPIVGGMAVGATIRLNDDTLPLKNSTGGAEGTDDGNIFWGSVAFQIILPNGHKRTVSASQSTLLSWLTGKIEKTATFAYVGADETRFTSLASASKREIVRVRSTAIYGWEYAGDTVDVWNSFTLNVDDCIVGMADIDLVTDPGDVLDVGLIALDGATVIESEDGTIPQGTPADDGSGPKTLPKGMNTGSIHHNTSVTFADAYQNAPTVIYSTGGATMEDRAKWGTKAAVDAGTASDAKPSSAAIYQDAGFQVTASGFTPLLYLRDHATLTAQNQSLAEDTSITSFPTYTGVADMSLATVPAFDDKYRVAYDITINYNKQGAKSCTVTMEARLNGGTFFEITSVTVNTSLPIGGGVLLGEGDLVGTFAGFDATGTDEIRCRVKDVSGSGQTSILVLFGTGAAGGADVRWSTSVSKYASMTPETGDEIVYFVQADVGQAEA